MITEQTGNLQYGASQRAGTVDQQHIILFQFGSGAGLDSDGGRLDHNGICVRKRFRKDIAVLFRYSDKFAVSAVDMYAADRQVVAHVASSDTAGIAVAAAGYLIDDNAVSYLQILNIGADLVNAAHHFMSNDPWIGCSRIGAMVDPHIRTADAGGSHFYKDVVFFVDYRFLNVNYLQLFWFYNLYSFH